MSMAKKVGLWIVAVLLIALVAAVVIFRPGRAARVGAGVAAHNLCSAVFVAGLDPEATMKELVRPIIGHPMDGCVTASIVRTAAWKPRSLTSFMREQISHRVTAAGWSLRIHLPRLHRVRCCRRQRMTASRH